MQRRRLRAIPRAGTADAIKKHNDRRASSLGGKFQTNDSLVSSERRSLDLEVLRGRLSAILDELILNGLSFVQRAKSGAFNSRDVHKHILPAFLRLDEAIALRRIEPLNGALRHC